MIRICAINEYQEILYNLPLEELNRENIKWFWVDLCEPQEQEIQILSDHFGFHPLAIEDCLDDFNQRPKIDFYPDYQFLVVHALEREIPQSIQLDMFVNEKFIVTFHKEPISEVEYNWDRLGESLSRIKGPFFLVHTLIDKMVDEYFPHVYRIEEELNTIEDNTENESIGELMEQLFDLRAELSKLRRTILPMRDLLYRIIHSERLESIMEQHLYFHDVHDHLLKLVEMIESHRDFSSDIRDSYLSLNSNNMNRTMMTLTVITTIFMPLTFIAGVYGMNFEHMPELHWRHGYFLVLAVMSGIGVYMYLFFVKKGWLRLGKKRSEPRR
ncbi:magnesium/cobalt transporter CorA [Bacillus sp. V5-8f]|uniref:magnesium/cobalt transporter CorA n=1 Tax=Bacillus sp. V5-8f TaxID=2053044 RepID=UPI000C78B04C|nr:magnesium/cobalt transporter CorA [Bacillus sp. V5-8f]PLT34386.1 magnesium and cobalt transport protein CorA [Bacillus sp. V5-8f]